MENTELLQVEQKIKAKLPVLVTGIVGGLLVVAGLWDKQISQLVMDQGSIYGTIFQNYGLIFPAIIVFMASQVFLVAIWRSQNGQFTKGLISGLLLVIGFYQIRQAVNIALYYTVTSMANLQQGLPIGAANNDGSGQLQLPSWYGPVSWLGSLVLMGLAFYMCQQWLKEKNQMELRRLVLVAFGGVVAVYAASTMVDTMKNLWGRFRPYEMEADWSNFTSWFSINGVNGHKSFPSGHSQMGWMALYLPLFIAPVKTDKRQKWTIFAILFGTLMAFSRVRIGAHFLSDVTVGSAISILVIFAVARLMNERFWKKA